MGTAAYKIVSHNDFNETEDEINTLLKEGWTLHGDLKVMGGAENTYSQAMVKDDGYGGVDSSVFVTISDLDDIQYAIQSIGEAIESVVGAMGHMAAGLSDKAAE